MSEFESHVPSYEDSKEEMVEVLSQDLFPWQDLDLVVGHPTPSRPLGGRGGHAN
jgi:hypothetical protein